MELSEKVKRGLETCVNYNLYECAICPYGDMTAMDCAITLKVDALAYIRELEAERDRYWAFIRDMGCESCSGDCDKCDGQSGWTWSGELSQNGDS